MNLDLVDRVLTPLQTVLDERGLKVADIDSLIILGGCTRIPVVQQKLKDFMQGKELGQNVNGDEAMAMGAVFRAANLSTAFQVRKIGLVEVTNYPVGVRLGDLGAPAEGEKSFSKRAQLFKRYNRVAKRKTVAFSHTNDFFCTMHYDSPKLLPEGQSTDIAYWNITGLTALMADEKNKELLKDQKPRVAVSFTLTSSGTVALAKVEATLEEMTKVPKKLTRKAKKAQKAKEGEASGEGDQESSAEEEEKVEYVDKKITHRFDLKFSMGYPEGAVQPMDVEQLKDSKKKLGKLVAADQLMKKIAASKNELESHIYAVRAESYEENFEEVTTEAQREDLLEVLRFAEDWLFDQEDDGYEKFQAKHKMIKEMSEPVYTRMREAIARPTAINQTVNLLNHTRSMVKDFEKERPWISQEDNDKVLKMSDEVESWLKNKTVEQDALKPHEKPAYLSHQLIKKLRPVAKFSAELLRRPKPKPKRRRRRRKATDSNSTDSNSTDSNSTDSNSTETDNTEEKEDKKEEDKKEEEKKEEL